MKGHAYEAPVAGDCHVHLQDSVLEGEIGEVHGTGPQPEGFPAEVTLHVAPTLETPGSAPSASVSRAWWTLRASAS